MKPRMLAAESLAFAAAHPGRSGRGVGMPFELFSP